MSTFLNVSHIITNGILNLYRRCSSCSSYRIYNIFETIDEHTIHSVQSNKKCPFNSKLCGENDSIFNQTLIATIHLALRKYFGVNGKKSFYVKLNYQMREKKKGLTIEGTCTNTAWLRCDAVNIGKVILVMVHGEMWDVCFWSCSPWNATPIWLSVVYCGLCVYLYVLCFSYFVQKRIFRESPEKM